MYFGGGRIGPLSSLKRYQSPCRLIGVPTLARYGEGRILKATEKYVCRSWSLAVDPIDATLLTDLYDWHRLKAFSGSAVEILLKNQCGIHDLES